MHPAPNAAYAPHHPQCKTQAPSLAKPSPPYPSDPAPLRQLPRLRTNHLALAKSPEINGYAHEVVDARVRALVEEERGEGAEGVDDQAGFHAAVEGGVGSVVVSQFLGQGAGEGAEAWI